MLRNNLGLFALLLVCFGLMACSNDGSSSSTVNGAAVKGPIEGATIQIFYFDDTGNEVEIMARNAPVLTGATGAYEFQVNPADLRDVKGPLIVRTMGGTMGGGEAPILEDVIADPTSLALRNHVVTCNLSTASTVAVKLLKKQVQATGMAPSTEDARTYKVKVEAALALDLEEDPFNGAQYVAQVNQCVDQNLDLNDAPGNNSAVNDYIDYLVANLSSGSATLDGYMDDPVSPGTDVMASFAPFGDLAAIVPGGPKTFLCLRFSTDKEFLEFDDKDEASLTCELTDATGTGVPEGTELILEFGDGSAEGILSNKKPATRGGQAEATLTTGEAGPIEILASFELWNGNKLTQRVFLNAPDQSSPLPDGAKIFAENLCFACHGVDGSGGVVAVNIQGKETADIVRAFDPEMGEEVHRGIDLSNGQSQSLSIFLAEPGLLPVLPNMDFAEPETCRICHPRQYQEWQGNMMAYGAISPVFSALESLGNQLTGGTLAKGHGVSNGSDLFCQRCHNPIDSFIGTFPTFSESNGFPLRDFATDVGRRGLSCDFCHQVTGPDLTRSLIGDLGDGIANNAFVLEPGPEKYGPFSGAAANPAHDSVSSSYLSSSEFCGSCHDVRPRNNDVLVGDENFQRLENLFTEWQQGPYGPINNAVGGVVSCQDCHMDAGAPAPAGTYPKAKTSVFPRPRNAVERRVSTHYFTGVDIALIPSFPGQDDPGLDSNGFVIGQNQRRQALLQSAASMEVSAPATVVSGAVLPIIVDVTNVGAGHNIPSGFSQERQLWIELTIVDANGKIIYQSGHLEDSSHPETGELVPDGNLDDEDLQNLIVVLDPDTGEATILEHGPDYNQRHDHPPVNQGLVNFGNEFLRVDPDTGHEEEVFIPFLANHMDNSHSIPPLETESVQYDVPLAAEHVGPLTITTRLLFRPFPPRFLRLLAQVRPDLVNEELVDRNEIVEMVAAGIVTVNVQ